MTNTKSVVELMLMPNKQGLDKIIKKPFNVRANIDDFTDSSSDEEKLITLAKENALKAE